MLNSKSESNGNRHKAVEMTKTKTNRHARTHATQSQQNRIFLIRERMSGDKMQHCMHKMLFK